MVQARGGWRLWQRDAVVAVLGGSLVLALYVRTLAPSVLTGDSAELQVLAHQFGTAHAPGHPVFVLVAHLFTRLRIGEVAWQVNLLSAIMGATAVGSTYVTARLLGSSRAASVVAATALAVSTTFWSQALIAEVYTTAAAALSGCLGGLLAWRRSRRGTSLAFAGLAGGLGVGIHSAVALAAPAAVLFLCLSRASWRAAWWPAIGGASVGAAISAATLVAADLAAPPANVFDAIYRPAHSTWGVDANTFDRPAARIAFLATARPWRDMMLTNWDDAPTRAVDFLHRLPAEFSWPLIGFAAVGLAALLKRDRPVFVLFLAALCGQLAFTFSYQIPDIHVLYLPSYLLLAPLSAFGLTVVLASLTRPVASRPHVAEAALVVLILYVGVWPRLAVHGRAVVAGTVPFSGKSFYPVDRNVGQLYRKTQLTVASLPNHAMAFLPWHELYAHFYAAHVDSARFDLRFVEERPFSSTSSLAVSTVRFAGEVARRRPVFFTKPWPELGQAGYLVEPYQVGPTQWYLLRPHEADAQE